MRKIEIICIHCTASSPNSSMQTILNGWRKKGWTANGYHWLIDKNGIATRLQDDELVGNGVKGHNSKSIHICYIGGIVKGKATDTRTKEQIDALKMLVDKYLIKYPNATVLGHRDLSPDLDNDGIVEPHEWVKSCPCFDVAKWQKSYESE